MRCWEIHWQHEAGGQQAPPPPFPPHRLQPRLRRSSCLRIPSHRNRLLVQCSLASSSSRCCPLSCSGYEAPLWNAEAAAAPLLRRIPPMTRRSALLMSGAADGPGPTPPTLQCLLKDMDRRPTMRPVSHAHPVSITPAWNPLRPRRVRWATFDRRQDKHTATLKVAMQEASKPDVGLFGLVDNKRRHSLATL